MVKIIVLGGGISVANMDVKEICQQGFTIGVNDAAIYAPVHAGLSMDRRWSEYRYNDIKRLQTPFLLRRNATQNLPQEDAGRIYHIYDCNHETDIFATIKHPLLLNGRNSGYCALNYAFNMAHPTRQDKIYLFGFDMDGGYWYPPYPWDGDKIKGKRSNDWIEAFKIADAQCKANKIELILVGESRIQNLKKITYEEFLTNA